MKKLRYCFIIFCLMVLSAFQARCQSSNSSQEISKWRKPFIVANPGAAELEAYEQRSIQKLKDFADYISIVSNASYDTAMRRQAMEQVKAIFENDKNTTDFAGKKLGVNEMLKLVYSQKKQIYTFGDISIKEPFSLQKDGSYKGKLRFATKKSGKTSERQIEIILKKVEKSFGDNKQAVWTVFLGNTN